MIWLLSSISIWTLVVIDENSFEIVYLIFKVQVGRVVESGLVEKAKHLLNKDRLVFLLALVIEELNRFNVELKMVVLLQRGLHSLLECVAVQTL